MIKYRIIDFKKIDAVPCPCGTARRGLADERDSPVTIHRTDIGRAAKPHYHKKTTEIYYIISCDPDAVMQLEDNLIPLHEEMAVYIPPGLVHRLVGKAKTVIVAFPKFDQNDEFILG